jgi:hypothetical protein
VTCPPAATRSARTSRFTCEACNRLVLRARDQASEVRGVIRSKLEIRSGKLLEFRVRPNRLSVLKAKGSTADPCTPPPVEPPPLPPPIGASSDTPETTGRPAAIPLQELKSR